MNKASVFIRREGGSFEREWRKSLGDSKEKVLHSVVERGSSPNIGTVLNLFAVSFLFFCKMAKLYF
jgi:hypothetical protein